MCFSHHCRKSSRQRDSKDIGHKFTNATLDQLKIGENDSLLLVETQCFRNMIANHGKAFAFESSEIGCVDPTVVEPIIIFTFRIFLGI